MLKIFLFWTHVVVGLVCVSVGFYFSLPIVLALVVAHRVHLVFFNGCVISRVQQFLGHFPRDVDFLEVVAEKFIHRRITRPQLFIFDSTLAVIPIGIALARYAVG